MKIIIIIIGALCLILLKCIAAFGCLCRPPRLAAAHSCRHVLELGGRETWSESAVGYSRRTASTQLCSFVVIGVSSSCVADPFFPHSSGSCHVTCPPPHCPSQVNNSASFHYVCEQSLILIFRGKKAWARQQMPVTQLKTPSIVRILSMWNGEWRWD